MTDKAAWQGQVGNTWAHQWVRTDRSFAGLTDKLLARAARKPFHRALDIGCGAGEVSMALARSHPSAEIIGVDVSGDLVETARQRAMHLPNLSFAHADASLWERPGWQCDLLISRHGVMFFDQPVAAFSHLRETSTDAARMVFTCFRSPDENPWASETVALLPAGAVSPSDPTAPGPFAFADAGYAEKILDQAGWRDIAFEAVDFAFVVGCGDDPVEDAMKYFAVIGPVARAAAELPEGEKARFRQRLRRHLRQHASGSLVALQAGAWIVTATA